MWHALDILHEELAVSDEIRAADASGPCRLVYAQLAVRWFKSKTSKGQWPPTSDRHPGITIAKRPAADGSMTLEVQQRWPHSIDHVLEGRMTCAASPWRSPTSWEFVQDLKDRKRKHVLPELQEHGAWDGKTLTRTTKTPQKQNERRDSVSQLTSTFGLLAEFPRADAIASLKPATLLSDGLTLTHDTTIVKCAEAIHQQKLAAGLTGYEVKPGAGFPLEFWVNEHNTVIYLLAGPLRAFVLAKVEALS